MVSDWNELDLDEAFGTGLRHDNLFLSGTDLDEFWIPTDFGLIVGQK